MSDSVDEVRSARLFIAVAVPAEVQAGLGIAQKELNEQLRGNEIRWVRPEQIHLTLKFLGNIALERIEELTSLTREVCRRFKPLQLCASGIGFFPSARRPRVVWASVEDKVDVLSGLQSAIEDATAPFAPTADRERFVGHLTIGRIKMFKPRFTDAFHTQVRVIEQRVFGEWTAVSVEIIRSELSSQGSKYHRVVELALEG